MEAWQSGRSHRSCPDTSVGIPTLYAIVGKNRINLWKRVRVVYGAGLENQCGSNVTRGSNPLASANIKFYNKSDGGYSVAGLVLSNSFCCAKDLRLRDSVKMSSIENCGCSARIGCKVTTTSAHRSSSVNCSKMCG